MRVQPWVKSFLKEWWLWKEPVRSRRLEQYTLHVFRRKAIKFIARQHFMCYHSDLYWDITLHQQTTIDLQLRSILALCEIATLAALAFTYLYWCSSYQNKPAFSPYPELVILYPTSDPHKSIERNKTKNTHKLKHTLL